MVDRLRLLADCVIARLAPLLLLRTRHLEIPRQGVRCLGPAEIYDLQNGSSWLLLEPR
jgi:hypothetical protein